MMVIIAYLRLAGGLAAFARWIGTSIVHPAAFLVTLIVVSGLLSALFVNDTICLVFTPIVLDVAFSRGGSGRCRTACWRSRDGLQYRQFRHDHRQSAEHPHRQRVRHRVPAFPSGCSAPSRSSGWRSMRC